LDAKLFSYGRRGGHRRARVKQRRCRTCKRSAGKWDARDEMPRPNIVGTRLAVIRRGSRGAHLLPVIIVQWLPEMPTPSWFGPSAYMMKRCPSEANQAS